MERLTEKTIGCFKYDLKDFKHKTKEFNDYDAFYAYNMAVKKLGEYEDLEEQGLLLRLPVTLESFVYTAEQDTTGEYEVFDWMVTAIGKDTLFLESDFSDIEVALTEIGKTVFLTKAEAEKALAEMEK